MLTSFSEFKFFQSFRVPVEEADDIRFSIEYINNQGNEEYLDDAQLIDVSVVGIGLTTKRKLEVGDEIRITVHFKKLHLDLNGTIVRGLTIKGEHEKGRLLYGAELEQDEEMKRFVEQYIYSFTPDRLRDCMVQMALSERYTTVAEGFEMFSLLISLFKDLTNFGNKDEFLQTILEEVGRSFNAQRIAVYLINPDKNELDCIAAVGADKRTLIMDYRQGIAGSVFTSGSSLNIDLTEENQRFKYDISPELGLKNVICSPLHNREDKVIGVVEVVNKRNDERFNVEDEKIMKVLSLVMSSVFHNHNPMSENSAVRRFSAPKDREHIIVGKSKETLSIRTSIVRLKDLDTPVLISGEQGVGKALLARILHNEGKRGIRPYFEVHCGGKEIVDLEKEIFGSLEDPGCLEKCAGGSVYFHDICLMPLSVQLKLISALKAGRVSHNQRPLEFRVSASSSKPLDKLVAEGKFNKELYEFLSKAEVYIEPLRKRVTDVKDLISHFLKMECRKHGMLLKTFAPQVMSAFEEYDWPGNVKELKNCVERAVLYHPKGHVISSLSAGGSPLIGMNRGGGQFFEEIPYINDPNIVLKDRLALIERQMILQEIKRANGNKSKAAREMGMSREALRKKLMLSQEIIDALEGHTGKSLQSDEDKELLLDTESEGETEGEKTGGGDEEDAA